MPDMLHQIEINALPEKIFEAITEERGLRSWWAGDSVAKLEVNTIAEFGSRTARRFFGCGYRAQPR